MASYITTEIDNTRVSNTITDTNNFVFVPINSSWGPHEDGAFIELTSIAQLKEIFGEDAEAGTTSFEQLSSYQYAAGMLRNGFSVLAKRVVNETNSKKAYAEDKFTESTTESGTTKTYELPGKFKLTVGGESFNLYVGCYENNNSYPVVAKYYGEYANGFEVTCTTKFLNSQNVGLFFVIKRNGVTLEENLFGKIRYAKDGEEHTLQFEAANPVSSYVDFGDYTFTKYNADSAVNTNFGFWWQYITQEVTPASETKYKIPFAGTYMQGTEIKSREGKNTTRAEAQALVKVGFSTNGDGSFRGIADKWVYDVKFISNGGYADEVITGEADPKDIANGMVAIAEARQDCVAFLDVPKGKKTASTVEEWSKKIEKSSYAALYSPWCKATPYGATVDVWTPASYLVLSAFAKSYTSGNSICDVPAGVNRGSVNITYPQFVVGGATQEKWQRGTGEGSELNFCINPIMNIRRYGYCIFGQRNLLELPYGTSSALQELCVRLTLNEIKKWVRDVALSLTFESNSSRTWNEFLSRTQSCLDTLVQGGYLTDYSVTRNQNYDDQTNSNKLSATISVYVTRALENFDINIEVNSSDITFEETVNS